MATPRDVKLRIQSVKNIAQVTRALEAVSASKVQKSMQAMERTRPYAEKAWQVLRHLAAQTARDELHPLLVQREQVNRALVVFVSGDRGLAGAYNANVVRFAMERFGDYPVPVDYITVGSKGRDLLIRRGQNIIAEFSDLPPAPSFTDISPIGRMAVDEFCSGKVDQVCLIYTRFINMMYQEPTIKGLLPLRYDVDDSRVQAFSDGKEAVRIEYTYEPDPETILGQIVPRFTALQVYQAIMTSLASEHAARMVSMRNATENAEDLGESLQLEYNKARQKAITREMLDIVGGAEAL